MNTKLLRAVAAVLMMLATLTPFAANAQDATPQASPLATPVAAPGLQGAVDWLISQQQEDGSWLGFSGEPDTGTVVDALITLGAAQEAGIDVGSSIDNAMAWLGSEDYALVYAQTGTGQAAKLVLALVAADADSLEIAGVKPLDLVLAGEAAESGLYGTGIYDHAYVLMALAATDSEIPATAMDFLGTVQAENGGFAWDGSTDITMVDSNTTSMVVQALVATGNGDSDVVARAVDFLRTTVTDQGAAYSVGAEADSNSTALVAQAFMAVDVDATHLITALGTFQNANGAFHWMHSDVSDNSFSTLQAIPALGGITLPVIPGMLDEQKAA